MRSVLLLLAAAATLFAADDPWTKVKDLKSGTEIAVFRKGATKPLEVKFADATDDALVIVNKKEQTSIPKDEIDRLDVRPAGRKVTSEIKHTNTRPDPTPPVGMDHGPNIPGNTYSSGVTFTKPGYETLYRRPSKR